MRATLRLGAVILVLAGAVAAACGDDDEGREPLPPPGPPEIGVVSVSTMPGQTWTPGDELPVALDCALRVIVNVGPAPGGVLTNWTLRPPEACGAIQNCGYVVVSLLDEDGERLFGTAGAQTSLGVDVSSGSVEAVRRLRVELFDGNTEEPFLLEDGGSAAHEIDFELTAPEGCEGGAGGMGGMGGLGGAGAGGTDGAGGIGGAPSTGGAGGSGGQGGAGGGQGGA